MALAHEIAVDKDFTLQKIQPANAVEKQATHDNAWIHQSLLLIISSILTVPSTR